MSEESMIRRVARALSQSAVDTGLRHGNWGEADPSDVINFMPLARAAIEAMREPTDGMIEASWNAEIEGQTWPEEARSVWTTMIGHTLT